MLKRALTLMTALVILLMAQFMRIFAPLLGWYLRDTIELSIMTLAMLAVTPFLLGFLGPLIAHRIGLRRLWWVAGGGLITARFAAQLVRSPGFAFGAAVVGLICALWLLPLLLGRGREPFITGLMMGLMLDTAIKGTAGTLDLIWIAAWPALVTVVLVCALAAALMWHTNREPWVPAYPASSLPLVALGPLLLLNWHVLQNIGWVSTLTGLSMSLALLFILVGDALVLHWMSRPPVALARRPWMIVGPGLLLLLASLTADQPGLVFAVAELVGLLSTGLLLVLIVTPPDASAKLWPRSLALSVGNLLLVTLLLVYYMTLDLRLPVGQPEIMAIVGFLLLLGAISTLRHRPVPLPVGRTTLWIARLMLVVPIVLLAVDFWPAAESQPGHGFPVRVMSYNIHSGYGAAGWHNPEDIAQVIEASGAEIVGFQEISRGAMADGNTDLVTWFSRRLEMPYAAFLGTTDPVWGIAILSRYPLDDVETDLLPQFDTRIRRGVVSARVDLGADQEIVVMSTHLHHAHERLAEIHLAQLETVLSQWAERPRTVLVGDMNASPESPEMALVLDAGFVDSWAEAGTGDGFTSNSVNPHHRIDWVLHTPDLQVTEISVPESLASDHFAVVATVQLR